MSQELLEELANGVADAMRAHRAGRTIVIDLPARRVRVTESGTMYEVFLGNAYDEYVRAAPAARPGIVAKYAGIGEARPPTADEWTRLLPKANPRRERELLTLRFGEISNVLTGIAIGDLVLELAIDLPQTIRMITASDLEAAGLSEEAAFATAKQNLLARSYQAWTPIAPGLHRSPWADFFDGARLALPSLFDNIGVRGDPIVTLPNRCTMLLTGSEEPDGLHYLYPATRALAKEDRPLHLGALRLVDGAWRPLGDADMDLLRIAPELTLLSSLQLALDYQVVGEHLREKLRGRGLHVEELQVIDRDDAPLMTVTKLPPVGKSVVPRADIVISNDEMLVWYKFEALLGDDLVPLDGVWPAHYEMRRRPTSSEFTAAKRLGQ